MGRKLVKVIIHDSFSCLLIIEKENNIIQTGVVKTTEGADDMYDLLIIGGRARAVGVSAGRLTAAQPER